MKVKLEQIGNETTLVCRAAYPGQRARVMLAGSKAHGGELRIFYELQCWKLDEQIPLRVEPGVRFTVIDVSPMESEDAQHRLMEAVDPSRLRPQTSEIADQSRRPTILL